MIPRRGLLAGLGALLAAPAIIRTQGLLMPVKVFATDAAPEWYAISWHDMMNMQAIQRWMMQTEVEVGRVSGWPQVRRMSEADCFNRQYCPLAPVNGPKMLKAPLT